MSKRFKCERFQAIIRSEDKDRIAHARCKMWTCAYCARKNAQQWRAGIAESITRLDAPKWTFFTFTLDSAYHDKTLSPKARYEASMNFVKRTWDTLMKRLKRAYGKFEYIRVLEQHKSGALHIHMLASCKVYDAVKTTRYNRIKKAHEDTWGSPQIDSMVKELGYGKVYDARPLENDAGTEMAVNKPVNEICAYITKYMTKHDSAFQGATKGRKIQTSRGIKKVNLGEGDEAWELKHAIYKDDDNPYPFDLTYRERVTEADYEGGTVYPLPYIKDEK